MPGRRVHLTLHPMSPPRKLHVAPPPLAQTIARPAGLPRRTRLMVRSAPPTQRPPTDSGAFQDSSVRPAIEKGGLVSALRISEG